MKNTKILIVEDDALSRGAMEKLLQSYNYETFSCALAEEAIVLLKQESFNILITDLHMPGMDGFELIRNARMIHPELLTIMMTGFPTDEIKGRAKKEGVDGFFSKPLDWDELYTVLNTVSGSESIQNVRKETRVYRPERIFLAIIFFILVIFGVQPSKAQPPFYSPNKPPLRSESQGACWQSSDLVLTETQTKTLGNLQCAFGAEAMPVRKELMSVRFELRHLIRDPNVPSKVLYDRQKKISELQVKLDNLSLSYQIKARSILTKEQLEQLPQDCSLGMSPEYDMLIGIGRGPRRGPR
jgi:DNA-binding response OmpR family regulator